MATLKDITDSVKKLLKTIRNPDKAKPNGAALFELFQWQKIEEEACAQQKALWASIQDGRSGIPDDAALRKKYLDSEAIVADTGTFAIAVKVTGASQFNRDLFITEVADEFNLTGRKLERLLALVEECKVPATARLSKVVIETKATGEKPANNFSGITTAKAKGTKLVRT